MTTFPNASNPKKKNDQIFLQTMQEDMNFKPETEIWKNTKSAIMITYLVEILTIPFHRVARLDI